jgi:hypothetical protein
LIALMPGNVLDAQSVSAAAFRGLVSSHSGTIECLPNSPLVAVTIPMP